jgi:lipopolysaccharide transport system permease protein/teichoic acid transport system permease protein
MAGRDIRTRYAGSLFGVVWNVIHPVVLITIFWVIFSLGFRVQPMNGVPFVVWLTAGMAAWFFFSESVAGSVPVVVANAGIIKKTVFQSQVLPVVKLLSSLVQHGVFLGILVVLMLANGVPVRVSWVQGAYYLLCSAVLALGISWTVSALNVFVRDTEQVTGVLLQVGFWATPVFWDIRIMPETVQGVLKFNPFFYIVQGYRDSFIYGVPFWEHPVMTVYFWGVAGCVFLTGILVFSRLKGQFADVL